MYGTRLPERLIPGRFDLIGNSHHFLHVGVVLGTEYAFKMVVFEINNRKAKNMLEETTAYVSIANTVGAAILVMFINAGIAFWFSRSLKRTRKAFNKSNLKTLIGICRTKKLSFNFRKTCL